MGGKRQRKAAASDKAARVAESPDSPVPASLVPASGARYSPDELVHPKEPLSVREGEALELAAQGKDNEEIAKIMGNSPRTVEQYMGQLYDKLDVDTREQVMALYHFGVETRMARDIAQLTARVRALEQQLSALRRQLRRGSSK